MFTKNAFTGKVDPVAESIKAIAEADYALKVEALKGDQTKLDKNKNNKLDADDFKILRGEKKTVKEAEDKPRSAGSVFDRDVAKSFQKKKPGESTGHESKKTSTGTQYTKKAPKEAEETNESFTSFKDKLKSGAKKVLAKVGGGSDEDQLKRLQKNMGATGSQVHGKKSMAKYNEEFDLTSIDPALVKEFMQTEEFEQLDELSKDTLRSYTSKSAQDVADNAVKANKQGMLAQGIRSRGKSKVNDDLASRAEKAEKKAMKKANKRIKGLEKAAKRLKEDAEEINELKKSTLASYVNKADDSVRKLASKTVVGGTPEQKQKFYDKTNKKIDSRLDSMTKAVGKMAKEEVEQIEERKLTKAEKKKKKKLAKGMKKSFAGFKARYGSRGKEVLYATATKKAEE